MSSYLPKDSSGNSPYAEGGGLYAIGLIHSNHGLAIMDYLMRELQTNSSEVGVASAVRAGQGVTVLISSSDCPSWRLLGSGTGRDGHCQQRSVNQQSNKTEESL